MIAVGLVLCLGCYFVVRRLARGWLGVRGVRTLSRRAEESYFQTPPARRLSWRLAGPAATYALAVALAFSMLRANGAPAPTTTIAPLPGGAAEAAGLRAGDRIVAIDGVAPNDWPDVGRLVSMAGPGRAVTLSVLRDGAPLSFPVTTSAERRIGVRPVFPPPVAPPVGPTLGRAALLPFTASANTALTLARQATGQEKVELAGPVGIAREARVMQASSSAGERFVLMLLAYPIALVWPIVPLIELLLTPRRPPA
ncbi:MAG TPA: PDZ domain-containing protein [Polyangia bacterium]|nr:PDZ domain-containing protein [Polyangia bacterium]